tara:strand:- start:11983 stop:13338 length:1356 start_codon:yes stop_codon:yes gene_type:complete
MISYKHISNYFNYENSFVKNIQDTIENSFFILRTFLICLEYGILYIINYNPTLRFENFIKQLASLNIFYVKIFQAISTNKFILNKDQMKYISKYTDDVPFTNDDIDISFETSINKTASRLSDTFEVNKHGEYLIPCKSGMIALIYNGKLNGEKVIIKVLRKNIKKRLEYALKRIDFICNLLGLIPCINSFNFQQIIQENKEILLDQTNFKKEIGNIEKMYKNCLTTDYVRIPKAYPEYTNDNDSVIVMEYLNGVKFDEINVHDKKIYCKQLANYSIKCILYNRLYHADLHPGNILFLKENEKHKIGIIDYGIMGELTRTEQDYYFKLLSTLAKTSDYQDVIDIFLTHLVEPKTQISSMSQKEYKRLNSDLASILSGKKNNNITASELYKINAILNKYKLILSKNFCKVQLCMAVSDSVISELSCNNATYMDHIKETMLSAFEILDSSDGSI